MSKRRALSHLSIDSVAVAIEDVADGETVEIVSLEGGETTEVTATTEIPLGHKIAVRSLGEGDEVVKYGVVIGKATSAIGDGDHVHVHNVKGLRWQQN